MLGAQTETDQRKRVDFAVVWNFLIGLKALEGIDGIRTPLPIGFAFEVTAIGKGFLDLLVALWRGLHLVRSDRRAAANPSLGPAGVRMRRSLRCRFGVRRFRLSGSGGYRANRHC